MEGYESHILFMYVYACIYNVGMHLCYEYYILWMYNACMTYVWCMYDIRLIIYDIRLMYVWNAFDVCMICLMYV